MAVSGSPGLSENQLRSTDEGQERRFLPVGRTVSPQHHDRRLAQR
jgi:hypothetical protein